MTALMKIAKVMDCNIGDMVDFIKIDDEQVQ